MAEKNKKGFLLGEFTLKLIVAVIGILLLSYLLFRLYSAFSGEDNLKKAQATLDDLDAKMGSVSAMADGQGQSYILLSPKSWIFINYPKGGPVFCGTDRCMCICKSSGYFDTQLEQCDDQSTGVCKLTKSYDIRMSPDSFIIDVTGVTITRGAGFITVVKQ